MNFESFPQQDSEMMEKAEKLKSFDDLFEKTLSELESEAVPTIEYNLPYPKEEFLDFLVREKNCLLHGSAMNFDVVEPRQANDAAKQAGNKNAVYAVTDPVLPIFYAIKDKQKINGVVQSGFENNLETGENEYEFVVPKEALENEPWTNGVIYIFDRSQFHQEANDEGELGSEWTSEDKVKPLAKLEVAPDDFRFLSEVKGA